MQYDNAAVLGNQELLAEFLNYAKQTHPEVVASFFEQREGNEVKDPRESALKDLFRDSGHKDVMIRHHYSLPSRQTGTIYDKQTYIETLQKNPSSSTLTSIPAPPDIWFRSLSGSVDYVNGTLHFPIRMPPEGYNLRSYTIRRNKVDANHLLFLAAQFERDRRLGRAPKFCDSSISYIADILCEKKSLDSKQYTPRKISLAQTKELLHAWVLVYVFGKKRYLSVLEYYLYAGYIVSITKKCGGNHEK